MHYKLFQKAIAERLGSHFTITLFIVFALLNWELIFQIVDMSRMIDQKIILVKQNFAGMNFWNWAGEIILVFLIIILFHAFSFATKIIGILFNDKWWFKAMKVMNENSKIVGKKDFDLVSDERDKYKEKYDSINSDMDELKREIDQKDKEIEAKSGQVITESDRFKTEHVEHDKLKKEFIKVSDELDRLVGSKDDLLNGNQNMIDFLRSIAPASVLSKYKSNLHQAATYYESSADPVAVDHAKQIRSRYKI